MPGDLDAAIREALDDLDDTHWDTKGMQVRVGDMFPETTAAIRAVLDLHKPEAPYTLMTEYRRCVECSMRDVTAIEWPCPTVRVIAPHLGVTKEADRG